MGKSTGWKELYFLPFIYLFLGLWFTATPIFKYDRAKIRGIIQPEGHLLDSVAIIVVISSIFSVVLHWDYVVQGLTLMMINASAATDLYEDKADVYSRLSDEIGRSSYFSILFHYFYSLFRDFNILLLLYYLTLKNPRRLIIVLLSFGTIFEILWSISNGNRTNVVLPFLTMVITYFAFSKFYTNTVKKKIHLAAIIVGLFILSLFMIITVSRFSEKSAGTQGSMVFYVGQANLNFDVYGMDNGGIRYGDRTMMLFKSWLGFDTPLNREDMKAKYQKLKIDDGQFYTFIGDFTIDFGPIVASLIFIIFTLFVIKSSKTQNGFMHFDQVILLYFVMCVCATGGMYLFDFSLRGGNWRMVGFVLLYMLFRFNRVDKKKPKVYIKQY